MYLEYYKSLLGKVPKFLEKYLEVPSIVRLKKVGYFCGMDYASKDIYDFSEYISRYDHSLTVALLVYKLTKNKVMTIAGLLHDIGTPCFSHVIDYMNKDYLKQESTEEYTEKIIREDKKLLECLEKDKIKCEDVVDFKKYSIVDLDRPKMCADRIDGIILNGIGWCKNISFSDIANIVYSLTVYKNEEGADEVGFNNIAVCQRVIEISESFDFLSHTKEDNYMMNLLGDITKRGLESGLYSYYDLYHMNEYEILDILKREQYDDLLDKFYNITIYDIPDIEMPDIKRRIVCPLVLGERIINKDVLEN